MPGARPFNMTRSISPDPADGEGGWGTETSGPSRRALLIAILAVGLVTTAGIGFVVFYDRSPSSTCGGPLVANPVTTTPIKHLFVIVKENHAFENYFGGFPGATGNPPNGSLPLTLGGSTVVHPFPLTGTSTDDFPHDVASSVRDYNSGQNNLFVAVANAAGNSHPEDAAGYYGPSQIPAYYSYARNYSLGDHFFTGFLGPTYPNRVFDLSAYAGTWGSDTPPPQVVGQQTTILDQLNSARIPWEYDWSATPFQLAPTFFASVASNPCDAGQIAPVSSLAAQLAGGSAGSPAPAVVYVDPSNDLTFSEHPPENVTIGEEWTVNLVNEIFSSPIASTSAVLLWFDESGGFWDPIPPPLTSTGLDGFRVPFLALSPWTPAGKVCSSTLDPASVLRFIDLNWGLPLLNPRVASAGDLSCFFNFTSAPRAPLLLPDHLAWPDPNPARGMSPPHGLPRDLLPPPDRSLAAVWRERPWPSEAFCPPGRSFVRQEVEGS